MDIYEILAENRKTGTIVDFTVPQSYSAGDNTATFTNAPAGNYIIAYNFEIFFDGVKDKAVGWKLKLNGSDSDQFSESVSSADADNNKSRAYGKTYVHTGGDIDLSIRFVDLSGGNTFIIDTCDVSITRVG